MEQTGEPRGLDWYALENGESSVQVVRPEP